jgi:TRAP-type mannitol/chloroaromatic compound transport system permease large subunit
LVGASAFSLTFRELKGDDMIVNAVTQSGLPAPVFILIAMTGIFIAGFFIDFIEIIFIFVPILAPIFAAYGLDLLWVGTLITLNLQTSFLTPPFGFSLFYLKGVAPPSVKTSDIYKGVIPFLLIQLALLVLVYFYPPIATWLPTYLNS